MQIKLLQWSWCPTRNVKKIICLAEYGIVFEFEI